MNIKKDMLDVQTLFRDPDIPTVESIRVSKFNL
jgi:hypothetical protein